MTSKVIIAIMFVTFGTLIILSMILQNYLALLGWIVASIWAYRAYSLEKDLNECLKEETT